MDSKKTTDALNAILRVLDGLAPDERKRVISTTMTFYDVSISAQATNLLPNLDQVDLSRQPSTPFANRENISPKEFLLQKKPRGEAQRLACLAFYLSHYRDMPHFKNADLNSLNTEAAQPKITNMPRTAYKAVSSGYLAAAGKETKQLSADGEQFVLALPNHEAASVVLASRRKRTTNTKTRNTQSDKKKISKTLARNG